MPFIIIALEVIAGIQGLLAYGTAYRLTKYGGDNGVALFGWFILIGLASAIPGLGYWLWLRNREGYHGKTTVFDDPKPGVDVKPLFKETKDGE